MTPELLDGLTISLIVLVTSAVLIPILCWILPDRSLTVHS
jgi:hypothetical protein